MKRGRGDFFLSLTLNDLVLTLLFLILLLSFGALVHSQEEAMKCREASVACDAASVDRLGRVIARLRELVGSSVIDTDEGRRLVLAAAEDVRRADGDALEAEKATLSTRIQSLEAELERLKTSRGEEGKPETLAELGAALEDAQRGYQACATQMRECGLGMPPCWTDRGGRAQYIYRVTIHEESLSITANWPEERTDDAARIPGALALPGDYVSFEEFGRKALPILAWSQTQTPECRHYVYIATDSEMVVKKKLLAIEYYFYKFLEP